jgi:hypothetical protein
VIAHPTLLAETTVDQLAAIAPNNWRPIIDWLTAPTDERPTLNREEQLLVDESALIANQQYDALRPKERRVELHSLLARRLTVARQRLMTSLITAQAAGNQTEIDRLHDILQSVKVNPSD